LELGFSSYLKKHTKFMVKVDCTFFRTKPDAVHV